MRDRVHTYHARALRRCRGQTARLVCVCGVAHTALSLHTPFWFWVEVFCGDSRHLRNTHLRSLRPVLHPPPPAAYASLVVSVLQALEVTAHAAERLAHRDGNQYAAFAASCMRCLVGWMRQMAEVRGKVGEGHINGWQRRGDGLGVDWPRK